MTTSTSVVDLSNNIRERLTSVWFARGIVFLRNVLSRRDSGFNLNGMSAELDDGRTIKKATGPNEPAALLYRDGHYLMTGLAVVTS